MRKCTAVLSLFFIGLSGCLFGQRDYLISNGAESGRYTNSFYLSLDFGSSLDQNSLLQSNEIGKSISLDKTFSAEALFGIPIYQNVHVELGISNRSLVLGYGLYQQDGGITHIKSSNSGGSVSFLVFPVRFVYGFPLEGSPLSVHAYGGVKPIIASHFGELPSGNSHITNDEGSEEIVDERIAYIENKAGLLVNLGISVQLDLSNSWSLMGRAEHDYGLVPMARLFVKHHKDGGAISNSVFNYGSGYRFSAGFQYRFSND